MKLKVGDRIKLKTKVVKDGVSYEVCGYIEEVDGNRFVARLKRTDLELTLGRIEYNVRKDDIFIKRRDNSSDYKRVGSALGEFVFCHSILYGKKGCLANTASESAHIFHRKWGMSCTELADKNFFWDYPTGFSAIDMEEITCLVENYRNILNSDNVNKANRFLSKIEQKPIYSDMKKYAKNAAKTSSDMTAKKVMSYILERSKNSHIDALIDKEYQGETRYIGPTDMYLPPEAIEKKKKEYEIFSTKDVEDRYVESTQHCSYTYTYIYGVFENIYKISENVNMSKKKNTSTKNYKISKETGSLGKESVTPDDYIMTPNF